MTKQSRSGLVRFALLLTIVGAINWGLIGFFNWNLVDAIFGGGAREEVGRFSRVIYALVGVAGVISLTFLSRLREVGPKAMGPGEGERQGLGRRAEVRP